MKILIVDDKKARTVAPSIESNSRLIDIPIPGMDVVQAARHLSEIAQSPAELFTAAYSDHATTKPNKVQALQKHGSLVELVLTVYKPRMVGTM
jgi:CheY-like chemotaxis protein